VENSSVDDVIEYKLTGRLDSQTAGHHQAALLAHLNENIAAIALDFSAVTHLSTAGIRVLLLTSRAYQAKGVPFVLHSLPPAVVEVVRITGLADLLTLRGV
jgi:anti-anti-sigma factor